MNGTDPTQLDARMGELNDRLQELRSAFVELRHQYHGLDVDLLDLADRPDASSDAPAVLDATQATLGDVTATLLLAEVGLDLVKSYSTQLKPRTNAPRGAGFRAA